MDAPPGDAVSDEVALRDLRLDLVGVAGHAGGHAAHVALKRGAVHGRLARHICHEVWRKNLGAVLGCAAVVADGPADQRLVLLGGCHIQCHDLLLHSHAAAGAGMTPICCIMPSWSQLAQSSTHFPAASKRAMTITPTLTGFPVAGMPNRVPACVPRMLRRPATRSPSATTSSTGHCRSGIPCRRARITSSSH